MSIPMQLVSVNVGGPRQVLWKGRSVTTGIFKEPVTGPIMLRTFNLDGDQQADLSVHGGVNKAVYAYPVEHYDYWRNEFPDMPLDWRMFGENFTVQGFQEGKVNIGDQFRIGQAVVMVTEPRTPCYKLAVRLGREDIVKRFLTSRRTGFYLRVLQEGVVEALSDAWRNYFRRRIGMLAPELRQASYLRESSTNALIAPAGRG
jgi:MOSC domain-containing protein YiiM